jgi:hypothetical protein
VRTTSSAIFTAALTGWLLLAATGHAQTLNVPPRPAGAPTGSQFVSQITSLSLTDRENAIYAAVVEGNVPDFLRTMVPVTVSATINGVNHTGTYYVIPDYLAIGTDADYFLEPTTPLLAQRLCDRLGCTLPTRLMVGQTWTAAAVKLAPQPIPPSGDMITVPIFAQHNTMVWSQRGTNAPGLGALVSGDKKDVIISTKIYTNFANVNITKPVVIFGWYYQNGTYIQPLYNGHEETYADYSHGIRLVQNAMTLDGSPNTITNILTDPNLAGLLSDEGASEGTSAGVIRVPRYTIASQGPAITTHPRSQTVLPGASPRFQVLASGVAPLGYQWQFNGVDIPSATNASFMVTNAQPTNAGSFTVVVSDATGATASRAAILRLLTNPHPIVFADDFETNSASNWNLFWGAANGIADYTANWAFDYSTTAFTFNGATNLIPAAPNSPDGSTRGVKFTVNNNDAIAATAAVNIYPKGQFFSGNFALKFDLWINYPGGARGAGAVGSTEFPLCGLNHLGTRVNWAAPSASASDGIWFGSDGDAGTANSDYRAYLGNPSGTQFDLTQTSSSGLIASNFTAAIFQNLFPASRFESAGAPGKNWVQVELRQTNNVIVWLLDGTVVAQRTNTSSFTNGNIMIGYMDPYSSIASPAKDAFVLFDNVRVEDLSDKLRFLSTTVLPGGQVQLVLSAVPGRAHIIEASTNLVDWTTVATLTGSNAPLPFLDSSAVNFSRRFYRAHLAPP